MHHTVIGFSSGIFGEMSWFVPGQDTERKFNESDEVSDNDTPSKKEFVIKIDLLIINSH